MTPLAMPIPPSCLRSRQTSAGFLIDQTDYQINVRSHFSFSTTPVCVTLDHGYHPLVTENLGLVEHGEYEVHHGATRLGTIQLPTSVNEYAIYGECLQPPATTSADDD